MRLLLPALLLSTVAAAAQTGFTTRTFPAANDQTLGVADFNHDGYPDLLGYSAYNNAGHVYLNDGSGGFKPPITLPTSATLGNIVQAQTADLLNNGFPDIVACTLNNSAQSYLVVYLNDGSGGFTLGQQTLLGGQCSSLVAGFSSSGLPEVVVAWFTQDSNYPTFTFHNSFETFFGDATGSLENPVTMSNVNLDIPSAPNGGDNNCGYANMIGSRFLLDGEFSLIVNAQCESLNTPMQFGSTFIADGDGKGHFAFSELYSPLGFLTNAQTVNLLPEGLSDDALFTSTVSTGNSSLLAAIDDGSGNFTFNTVSNTAGYKGVTSGDFNADQFPDIAASYLTYAALSANTYGPGGISIYSGSPSGAFTTTQSWTVGDANSSIQDIVAADFNADGRDDLATLVAEQGSTGPTATTLYIYTRQAPSACPTPATANTSIICTPARGASVPSAVTVTAASNVSGFTLNRLYLDTQQVYQVASQTISTSLIVSGGPHTLVLVSYNNKGQAFTSTTTFIVSAAAPSCVPSTPGANICSPSAGTSSNDPVTIIAGVLAHSGNITATRAYIDNVAVFTTNNPQAAAYQQVSQPVTLPAGAHRLVIVGYQSTGGTVTASSTFTVSPADACFPSTPGVAICSPTNGESDLSTSIAITAGATAASGYITALRVYVDNAAATLIDNPNHSKSFGTSTFISAGPGPHRITVVGYQSTGGSLSSFVNVFDQ